jgi:hypothetical protein
MMMQRDIFIGLTVVMQMEVRVWCCPMGKIEGLIRLMVIKGWGCEFAAVKYEGAF